jgi:lysozyme
LTETLFAQIARHEGLRLTPYRCTAGKLTIGYGRNLDDRGIREEEARVMLSNDIAEVRAVLRSHLVWFAAAHSTVQDVLVNMGINLGTAGLLKFRRTLAYLEAEQYNSAADEMLDSLWARQVPNRAKELADLIRGLA